MRNDPCKEKSQIPLEKSLPNKNELKSYQSAQPLLPSQLPSLSNMKLFKATLRKGKWPLGKGVYLLPSDFQSTPNIS